MKFTGMVFTFAALLVSLAQAQAQAQTASDDVLFHQILIGEVRRMNPKAKVEDVERVHFAADQNVQAALGATSIEAALAAITKSDLSTLVAATQPATPMPSLNLNRRPLTLVVVPGVFAEFIKNHAFEEVFERPSALRDQFAKLVAAKASTDRVGLLNLFKPGAVTDDLSVERRLDQVILTGETNVSGQTVRVILFNTEFSSLESLGDSKERAAIFNRRLEKYLALTGPQDLALIGYSRGTILGLEMLAQAKAAGRPWIADVKAMISLSGVAFGSTLADDAMQNATSPAHLLLTSLNDTVNSLQLLDEAKPEQNRSIVIANTEKWAAFGVKALEDVRLMNQGASLTQIFENLTAITRVDPRAPLGIILRMWKQLGLDQFRLGYNANILRFRYFVSQLLASVDELSTPARTEWWKSHELPKNVTYYAITAAMANPKASVLEAELFKNPLTYGSGSYDDASLLQNHNDYTKASGVLLNDSQVSVVQAAFLPNVIAQLNSANAGLKTKFLGISGTHHWGMALREVNKMFGGQVNGYPREAMLKALATQVKLDNP